MSISFEDLVTEFQDTIQTNWIPPSIYENEFQQITESGNIPLRTKKDRISSIQFAIQSKLDLNNNQFKRLLSSLASKKILLNYHQKSDLKFALDNRNKKDVIELLLSISFDREFNDSLTADLTFHNDKTLRRLLKEFIAETKKESDILEALFSHYLFRSFNTEFVHKRNSKETDYKADYFDFLQKIHDNKLQRTLSLAIVEVTPELVAKFSSEDGLTDHLNQLSKHYYQEIDNQCYFAIHYSHPVSWSVIANNILFSEKFQEELLTKGYFHPKTIAEKTSGYIPKIDQEKAKFELANTGFTFKDSFIIDSDNDNYDVIILFEKNVRDETKIPCPACRSFNVRGNSYPTLGVRSWECYNPICPDKSKFNRGKRYSLSSIIRQQAILDDNNLIPIDLLKEWRLDKVSKKSKAEVHEFLIKSYSLKSDSVDIINGESESSLDLYGRTVNNRRHIINSTNSTSKFYDSAFFHRFRIEDESRESREFERFTLDGLNLYNGDSRIVLQQFPNDFFDAAVTSPPYYNAKEYSQWSNIYCYLYDMYNNAAEVYRTLKSGGIYLYNIFDYFDNERNVAFSAMGKKRMILGYYIIHLFEQIGFKTERNIIWYKGHIQGNRNFNQGNFSPYYQAPLNCWEHILVFRKGESNPDLKFPSILDSKPFHKMVGGKNILGHTAPFPESIPNLLYDRMEQGSRILDPYAGSFTTLRARRNREFEVYGIEMDSEYFELGKKLILDGQMELQF